MDLQRISGLLRKLSPRQEKAIRLFFGLGCQRPHSAREVAQECGVSAQVIAGLLGAAQRRLAQDGLSSSQLREAARWEADLQSLIFAFDGSQEQGQSTQTLAPPLLICDAAGAGEGNSRRCAITIAQDHQDSPATSLYL